MSTDVAVHSSADLLERVVVGGDLSRLAAGERMAYYKAVCESIGLNPLTRPLGYLTLNGKLVLYALKECTDQLRTKHDVSIVPPLENKVIEGVYVVTAYAKNGKGRTDTATGAVFIQGLRGEALANAMMKAETKAKRRVTLSICGLGMLDESEVDSIPGALVGEPPSPPAPDQAFNEAFRGQLLEQITVDSKFLGLMKSEYKKNWAAYCGTATEEHARIDHLTGLAAFLANKVQERKASGAQESVPF